jgi:hypothetical protein
MITVNGKQAKEIEYLIEQAIQGHHVLFDDSLLKTMLHARQVDREQPSEQSRRMAPLENENTDEFRHHEKLLEQILILPSLVQKRAFLDRLKPQEQAGLLRLWLNVVENSLYQSTPVRH